MSDRLSLVTSGRTNVLALSTADGLVMVDSGAPELSAPLMGSLRQLSPGARVRTLFNTHWHVENTGANEPLGRGGATIVAHENTRLWMATPTWVPEEDRYRPPRPEAAHPDETFYEGGSATIGGERIDYGYLIDAHTNGDIYVFFRDANVLAAGDVASPARDPQLDWFTGAWLGGRVDAMDRLLALSTGDTRIVPGAGPVMSRADLQAERDMMETIYQRTVDQVRQGFSAEDMLGAGVIRRPGRPLETMDILREAGAGVNARITDVTSRTARIARPSTLSGRQGQTALFFAVEVGRTAVVRYLLEHGADVHVVDDRGRTPIDVAAERAGDPGRTSAPEIVDLLERAGAARR